MVLISSMIRKQISRRRAYAKAALITMPLVLSGCGGFEWPLDTGRPQSAYPAPTSTVAGASAPSGVVIVQRGDTVYAISRRHTVPVRDVIKLNGLAPPYMLQPGQRLRLPGTRFHVVARGETLYGISREYGVDVFSLGRINDLKPPYTITTGQRLQLPGVEGPVEQAALTRNESSSSPSRPSPEARPPVPAPPPLAGGRFAWPVQGRVISGFGPKAKGLHNDGINIAAPRGTPVRAAEEGVVAYAGNELRGFGNLLLVRHADGWVTAYAHSEKLLVERGDKVSKGQVIARVGSSGTVSSPQLHFELRKGKQAVDPTRYLG
ncbi:MAG: M23 family metallopeptidase [Rhodospirillales bacterium]|nr:M23 family metallopeptidase [Rhodospirillales bacterium]